MHKDMPPEAEQYKAMVPEFQVTKMELLYNGTQSLFHPVPREDEEDQMPQPGGEGRTMNIRIGGMDAETFRDYEKEQIVEGRELGPKKYIIEDTLRGLKWKLEEDTMSILGYLCHKATTSMPARMRRPGFVPGGDTTHAAPPPQQQVVAWYTNQVESQAGPDNLFGLPGLILKANMNQGSLVYTALSVEPAGAEMVKAPSNGKKITRAEFRKMMDEQFKGMGGPGGGPQIQVIRQY